MEWYMPTTKLRELGAACTPADIRAFLLHTLHVAARFTGNGLSDAQLGTEPVEIHMVRNRRMEGPHGDGQPACVSIIGNPSLQDVMVCVCDCFRELLRTIEANHTVLNKAPSSKVELVKQNRIQLWKKKVTLMTSVGRMRQPTQVATTRSSIEMQHRLLMPSDFIERFQAGQGLAAHESLSGLCGRIVRGRSPKEYVWLAGHPPSGQDGGASGPQTCFVMGGDGLARVLRLAANFKLNQGKRDDHYSLLQLLLLEVGFPPLLIYEAIKDGYSFELVVFCNTSTDHTQFRMGARVHHQKRGYGTVMNTTSDKIYVQFDLDGDGLSSHGYDKSSVADGRLQILPDKSDNELQTEKDRREGAPAIASIAAAHQPPAVSLSMNALSTCACACCFLILLPLLP